MDKGKIVFVTPPYERIAPGYEFVKHVTNACPSLGLLSLAAQTRAHGYEPSIIESDIFNLTVDDVAKQIIRQNPAYVGLTLFTVGVGSGAEIARKVKAALPGAIIITGGPQMSSMGRETMEQFPEFDIAVVGEGEATLVALLDKLRETGDVSTVPGIIYREGQILRATAPSGAYVALDELPMPAWDLLPQFPHAYRLAIYDFPQQPIATIAASRGCPFLCKFCDTSTFGAKVRYLSAENVFAQMKHLKETWGVRHIQFVDDLWVANNARTEKLCHMLLESGMKMTWSCTARVDKVSPGILALMKKAGCWEISFGLETGSPDLLLKMNKVINIEKSEQALQWANDAGIRTKGLFMLGYPGETLRTIEETLDFVTRVPLHFMNLSKFTPYPGTQIYRDIYGTNIRKEHWDMMNGMNFIVESDDLTIGEMDRQYKRLLTAFHRRPRIFYYYTRLTFENPEHFARLLRFGLGFLKARLKGALSAGKKPQPSPAEA
ncbi:MAG: B12-binding domain-containing radical SAM protein [Nitrospinota bacterium]|nr:B12-binding domain-containing radical SAM protein [Nitrospinota bacterium]